MLKIKRGRPEVMKCKNGHLMFGYNLASSHNKNYPDGTRCRQCMNRLSRDHKRRKKNENTTNTTTTAN